jgi:8-oxo-dGTP diphosphatase
MIHAVIGLLKREDKILVARRPIGKPYSGYWEFPGGKIEPNESSEAALKRELAEELGVQVAIAKHCFTHTHAYPDKTVHLDVWLVESFFGVPHPRENQPLRWANFTEIQQLDLLQGNWAILEKIQKLCT